MKNKNVIYVINKGFSIYSNVTLPIVIKYASMVKADVLVADDDFKSSHTLSPHYDKFDIWKQFVESDYDKMLFMDLDIRILSHTPNIFEQDVKIGLVPDHKSYLKINSFNNWMVDNNHSDGNSLHYFNGGVMLADKDSMKKMVKSLPSETAGFLPFHNLFNDVDQPIINYCLTKLDVDVLDNKWNRVARDPEVLKSNPPDGYFIHYLANKSRIASMDDPYREFSL
tara:strand:+ start:4448 stop:5122 length:675 start_codon:yes stop_codon:yes gene_type:complete